jgi:hypothetical protein
MPFRRDGRHSQPRKSPRSGEEVPKNANGATRGVSPGRETLVGRRHTEKLLASLGGRSRRVVAQSWSCRPGRTLRLLRPSSPISPGVCQGIHDPWHPIGIVVAAPREHAEPVAVAPADEAKAVMLDLVRPLRPRSAPNGRGSGGKARQSREADEWVWRSASACRHITVEQREGESTSHEALTLR